MGFLSVVVTFLMRGCLSVAITEMVEPLYNNNTGNSNGSVICPLSSASVQSSIALEMVSNCSSRKNLLTKTLHKQAMLLNVFKTR